MYRSRRSALSAVAAVLATAGLRATPAPLAAQTQPRGEAPLAVVASFSVLGDLVANVGGDRIALRTLAGAGGDPHAFEPTPADARALASAAVLFEVGVAFETWLPALYRAARSRARRVAVTEGLPLLRADESGHRHGEWDPHVWHDVALAVRIVEAVRDALSAADPAHREVYESNAAAYAGRLWALDTWVRETVACCTTEAGRRVATAHDSLTYLAARYGFVMLATPTGSVSTEAEPSARQIAAVVEQVRASGVRAVFPESTASQRTMQRIAQEAGVALAAPLYADALGPPGSPADTYLGMMTHNVSTIVEALNGAV